MEQREIAKTQFTAKLPSDDDEVQVEIFFSIRNIIYNIYKEYNDFSFF